MQSTPAHTRREVTDGEGQNGDHGPGTRLDQAGEGMESEQHHRLPPSSSIPPYERESLADPPAAPDQGDPDGFDDEDGEVTRRHQANSDSASSSSASLSDSLSPLVVGLSMGAGQRNLE